MNKKKINHPSTDFEGGVPKLKHKETSNNKSGKKRLKPNFLFTDEEEEEVDDTLDFGYGKENEEENPSSVQ